MRGNIYTAGEYRQGRHPDAAHPRAAIFHPDALPPHRARARPPLRSRIRRTSCWSPPRTSTATPPTGTTSQDRPFAGGVARVATVVDSLRARYPGQVVVVDAGDLLQGDPFATYFARVTPVEPHPIVEALNLAGYDAATPGNHDFDWGLPFLARAVAEARFPYVSANSAPLPATRCSTPRIASSSARASASPSPAFTTPGTMVWDGEQLAGRARVAPIDAGGGGDVRGDAAGRRRGGRAGALRARGPRLLRHDRHRRRERGGVAGLAPGPPRPRGGRPLPPRDARFGARRRALRPAAAVRRQRIGRPYRSRARDGRWRVRRIRADLVSTAEVAASPLLARRLGPARDSVRAWTRTPIGLALGSMRAGAARIESSPIMGFVHDVQRRRTGAELSAASAFDLRAGFDADTIRVAHVVALYPFDNTLRAVRLSGAQLKAYLEWSARYFQVDPAGGSRSTTRCPATTSTWWMGRSTRSTCGSRSASGSSDWPCAARPSSRATATRWPSTATARPAPADTTCCAARPWSTTRASGSPSC